MIPHSHLDAGWLNSADGYFNSRVRYIFDAVIDELIKHEEYTYTVGDIYFFRRWYRSKDLQMQSQVKRLVQITEQLEFVHGGLVSSDEACPSFSDVIRNFEIASDWIWNTFQKRVTTAWQLDPFGHSAGMAKLFASMGLSEVVFARMNHPQFTDWNARQSLQFLWKPKFATQDHSFDFDGIPNYVQARLIKQNSPEILGHVLSDHYTPPFPWNNVETGSPHLKNDIGEIIGSKLLADAYQQAQNYKSDQVIVMWGDDFSHRYASNTYLVG